MSYRTLVVAPHPDDELLGVGGTLLRRKAEGAEVAWLLVTCISVESGWSAEQVKKRAEEIERVRDFIGFDAFYPLDLPTTRLDTFPMGDLVGKMSQAFGAFEPNEVFLPHPLDIHTDHRATFIAGASCAKSFRCPSIRRVLAYETISETDFGVEPGLHFRPNVFVDIARFQDRKLEALEIYASELGPFPFPRSREAVLALAASRGASSGFKAAEAFELLRERS